MRVSMGVRLLLGVEGDAGLLLGSGEWGESKLDLT